MKLLTLLDKWFPKVIPDGTDPNPDTVGQSAHILAGLGLVLLLVLFLPLASSLFYVALFALLKETAEALGISARLGKTLSWEGKQPAFRPWGKSSARDFVYFLIGEASAFISLIGAYVYWIWKVGGLAK